MARSQVQTAAHFGSSSLWTPSPAVQHGIRFGVATAGAIWLGYAMGFPQPTWPVITVMMIAQPTAGASIQKAMLRLCGTMLAGVAAIVIFGLVGQDHLLLAASVSLVYGLGVYGMTGPRHGYAGTVMAFTTGIILGDAFAGTTHVENLAFDRVTLVGLGILAGLAAEAVFWPTRTEPSLRSSLEGRFDAIAKQLDETRADWREGRRTPRGTGARDPAPFLNDLTLLDQLRMQLGVGPKRVRAFSRVSLCLHALEGALRSLASIAKDPDDQTRQRGPNLVGDLLGDAGEALADLADALTLGRRPAGRAETVEAAFRVFEDAHAAELAALSTQPAESAEASSAEIEASKRAVSRQSVAAPILRRVVSLIVALEGAVEVIAADQAETGSFFTSARAHAVHPTFTIDPLRVELALRGGLAVAAVFVVMPLMGWPVSATPMTLAFMVAAVPTRTAMGQTVAGMAVAVIAAAIVADLSIMYVIPRLGRSPTALLFPLIIAGGAGYLMVAKPKLAPIAPLFALITVLSVFGGARAPDNVEGPYLTAWTISVGIVIGVAAQRLLWPRTASELLRIRLAQQIGLCLDVLRWTPNGVHRDDQSRILAIALARHSQKVALVTQLNAHAHEERAEAGLDDASRAALISGVDELFDTSLHIDSIEVARETNDHTTLRSLSSTLDGLKGVVLASLEYSARSLEHGVPLATTGLSDAASAAEAEIEAIRGLPAGAAPIDARQLDAWLARIDGIKRLVSCALAIENWVCDWQHAKESAT